MAFQRKDAVAVIAVLALALSLTGTAFAKTAQQAFTFQPGWNAVFLQLDPADPDPSAVFADLTQLAGVWMWNPRVSTVEFIQDPDTLIPGRSEWLAYFPENPVATTLHAIFGERAYLIKVGGDQSVEWTVSGEPTLPKINWKPASFNLVGFHLAPEGEPFFEDFFSASSAHDGQEIHILNGSGRWERVTSPATTRMKAGEAFWVFCREPSEFTGPFSVRLARSDGLHYGKSLSEQTVRLSNASAAAASVSGTVTGTVPLSYWHVATVPADSEWTDFPLALAVDPGREKNLRVAVKRSGLTAGESYEDNLVVSNGAGMRLLLPVSVEGVSHEGLWVGTAAVGKVSEPRVEPNAQFPLTDTDDRRYGTDAGFSFRLIVHVDATGQARLLKQVIFMWDTEGERRVIFTDDAKISQFSATGPDGKFGAKRLSSAAFSRLAETAPVYEAPMTGSFDEAGGSLAVTITVAQDDPANPFRHGFHPDHKDPARAYAVTRAIEMIFSTEDADGDPVTGAPVMGWGSTRMGGIYRETLTGLHKAPIKVEGTFLLEKVNSLGTLE